MKAKEVETGSAENSDISRADGESRRCSSVYRRFTSGNCILSHKNNKKRQIVLTHFGRGVMVDGGVLLEGDFVCLGSLLEGLR